MICNDFLSRWMHLAPFSSYPRKAAKGWGTAVLGYFMTGPPANREQRSGNRDQGSEKDGGVRFVVSHSSVLSAVEGSAFFMVDEWGTAVLGYFMTGPPACHVFLPEGVWLLAQDGA